MESKIIRFKKKKKKNSIVLLCTNCVLIASFVKAPSMSSSQNDFNAGTEQNNKTNKQTKKRKRKKHTHMTIIHNAT